MYVLTVAPLADGIPHESLTYFSKEAVEVGDLVEIYVRRRQLRALVLETSPARDQKQELRSSGFGIKKISKILSKNYIHPILFAPLSEASSYHLASLGKLIYDFLPEKLFGAKIAPLREQKRKPGFDILLLQHSYDERIARYKSVIRESFARKESLVIFFPTITDLERAEKALSKGIEEYVLSFHSGIAEKLFISSYTTCLEEEHPLLILSTPSLIPWVREDIGTIVIEREHSHYYFGHGELYDMKDILERLARASRARLILGSHLLSLKTHLLFEEREAAELMPLQYRNDAPIIVVPMTDENKSGSPYLSKKAVDLLEKMHKEKSGHYFVYAHRKGMYPTTICADCGTLFTCEKCGKPYVLHKIGGVRTFVCHSCEHIVQVQEDSMVTCIHCGGWRMSTLGIATGGIEEELLTLGIPTFCIDGERTPTRPKIKKVYDSWRESPYGVLIGTEMAHNVVEEVDEIILLSLDSLFALPEYRTDEKILHMVTEMCERITSEGQVILQTRLSKMPVMRHLKSHSFSEFYRETLRERKELHLPPYYVVIKSTFYNLDPAIKERLEQECVAYEPLWFEAGGGKTLFFIHIPRKTWEEDGPLRDTIKTLCSFGEPKVNPLHFFL